MPSRESNTECFNSTEYNRDRRAAARKYVQDIKRNQPCFDCKQKYPHFVLDFDHVRGAKHQSVSTLVHCGAAIKRIANEIAKCDLVCSNCHRVRTNERHERARRIAHLRNLNRKTSDDFE